MIVRTQSIPFPDQDSPQVQSVLQSSTNHHEPALILENPTKKQTTYPTWTDTLVAFASYKEYVAYRDSRDGGWFLKKFCEFVETEVSRRPMCIKRILEKVQCL